MTDRLAEAELLYAATERCHCGAGRAYPLDYDAARKLKSWVCSRVLKGEADAEGHDSFHWSFFKIREETSVNNKSASSTRPAGTIARTLAEATCPKCSHEWRFGPYDATGGGSHWLPGNCPGCGYTVGAGGSWDSKDGEPIRVRFTDVVIERRTESGLP
jgi:hypothetical protein